MAEQHPDARRHAIGLITDFGKSVGIDEMAFDKDGRCDLSFDDQHMAIVYDDQAGYLCLEASVLEIPSSPSSDFFSWILEDNFTSFSNGIGCLGLHREAGIIFWLDRRPAADLSRDQFENWLGKSIERAEFWARQLRERANSTSPQENEVERTTQENKPADHEVLFRA
ncbi:MAG: type III secretion system chaperone [Roseibium album]|uniref:type III secretion system chaperone n=1 Tax=Roseibium album TaxID=311410 RepID=UPI00131A57F7|nr:hypothetical protein [Labrenzia sp. EL_142]